MIGWQALVVCLLTVFNAVYPFFLLALLLIILFISVHTKAGALLCCLHVRDWAFRKPGKLVSDTLF